MNIESITQGNQTTHESIKVNTKDLVVDNVTKETNRDRDENKKTENNTQSLLNIETKFALDKATGLLQSITKDKITDRIIRKMPSDEYLHLLHMMDEVISGSIKKET